MRATKTMRRRPRSGQGKTEYVIIIVTVAIMVLLAVALFGDEVLNAWVFKGGQPVDENLQVDAP